MEPILKQYAISLVVSIALCLASLWLLDSQGIEPTRLESFLIGGLSGLAGYLFSKL